MGYVSIVCFGMDNPNGSSFDSELYDLLELFVHFIELYAVYLACCNTSFGLHRRKRPLFLGHHGKIQDD